MRRDVFQAIADPVRREIIDLISKDKLNIKSIAENFSISQQAVSKHIKILEECGILDIDKQGRERFCSIKPEGLIPAYFWIERHQQLWEDRIDHFESYVKQLKNRQSKK
ncbi:MAG: metalloregulator ArsR/SmtB family transcription factor [Bacteroidota bacterium]